MDHGKAHASLSPSSAERWLSCPASIRMIESLPAGKDDSTSVWADEGTRAHNLAEIEASRAFGQTTLKQYKQFKAAWLKTAAEHGDDVEEMERHVRAYISVLQDVQAAMPHSSVFLEQRVQTGVPGCWGTGDAIIVSPIKIHVIDFKYGQGVVVRAEANPQLMLYGVGSLELYDGVLGDCEVVGMSICQPRVGDVSHYYQTAEELRAWRNSRVLPIARETQDPDARFGPSDTACRWCPAAGICKPRMAWTTQRDFGNPDVMTAEDLADAWRLIETLRNWCNAVEKEALKQAYSEGASLPGLKVVMSGGRRSIPDVGKAIETLTAAGYDEDQVSRRSLKALGDLERLVGKARLPEVLGDLLVKSPGSPSIVPEADARAAINSIIVATQDFQGDPALVE